MEKTILEANVREISTKGNLNSLRKNGRVPGVFYIKGQETLPIDVSVKNLNPLVFTSETHLISLQVPGHDEYDCVIKDVQFDPVTDKIVHFDLYGLTKGEKITIEVPLRLIGNAIGIKEGGILQHTIHKLEIECLPKDIPQFLEINVSELKLGDSIHAGDLSYDNITILTPADSVIVSVTHPKVEKEPVTGEAPVEEKTEPEVIGKGKTEEEE